MIYLIIGFLSNRVFADEVPLPNFQEMVAAYVEDAVNNSKMISHLYERYEKGFVKSKNKPILAELKKETKKMELPKVTRNGRLLTFQVQNQKVTLEIVDALNEQFVINGRKVNLLKFATLAEKHQYLFRLFKLEKTVSLEKTIINMLFFGEVSYAESTSASVGRSAAGTIGGGAIFGGICLLTAPACVPAMAAGAIIGTVVAGAYNVCVTFQMIDMCTKNDVIVGSSIAKIGQELEKLTDESLMSVEISCSNSTIKVTKADTPEKTYSDSGSALIKALKRGCSADKKLFVTNMASYSDKRNEIFAQQNPDSKNAIKVNIIR